MPVKNRDAVAEEDAEKPRVFFRAVPVFDRSQVDAIEGADPAPLEPPCEPLTGDSHRHLLEPLQALAASLGYSVSFAPIVGSAGGWCDHDGKRIAVDASQAVNGQVRILVHELAHALGVGYREYGRRQAEVIVDSVIFWRTRSMRRLSAGCSVGDGCHRRGGRDVRVRRDWRRSGNRGLRARISRRMRRHARIAALVVAVAALLALPAEAKNGVRAILDDPVNVDAKPGTRVRVAWHLVDKDGHRFGASGIYLRVSRCGRSPMRVPARERGDSAPRD